MTIHDKVAAVVVLYNPDSDVAQNIRSYIDSVDILFAVDNSDNGCYEHSRAIESMDNVLYINNGENLGVAAALNIGARKALEGGCDFLLMMDQDSIATPHMIERMVEAAGGFDMTRVGIISPYHEMVGARPPPEDSPWTFPCAVPTSGNLLNLSVYRTAGPFREELFIDFVDIEYCLRLKKAGFMVLQVNGVKLHHFLGKAQRYWMFTATHHPPLRKYYKTRNRLYVGRLYNRDFIRFFLSDKLRILKEMVKILLVEHNKREKLKMMVRGYCDYRKGVFGKYRPAPAREKVAFFTQAGKRGAASRYRVYQYLPYLRAQGIVCRVYPAVPGCLHRLNFFSRNKIVKGVIAACVLIKRLCQIPFAASADIIFFQKPVLPFFYPVVESCARLCKKRIVFDFDDAIFYRPPKWGGRGAAMPVDVNFVRIMALADVVFAGNAYLAQHASEYSGNVMVLPTVVDPAYYTVDHGRSTREGPVVIGWIGSPTTLFYVERLAAVFRQLAGEYDYTLKIIGARGAAIPGVKVVCEDWSLENEREQLASIDIGIAPLDDSEWSRGKCGLKILVYMASGVPVAASPYGVNGEIIRDGENGLLAVSDDEWREKLTALMLDRELRARLAQEGRKTVEANYSLPAAAAELAAFLKELNNK